MSTMKTLHKILIGLGILALPLVVYGASVFNSNQVGSSPSNGKVLQTNGSVSTWVATSTLGISGGTGLSNLNGLTGATQTFATDTAGSIFHIGSSGSTHTFSLPFASASNTGQLQAADWTTFNNKQAAGNYITALTGDVTATGPGSVASTLATVNSNVGSFGSSTSIPNFTVNGKGLITAAGGNAVIAPAGTLTGATLASGVTASSLTSVGTLTALTVSGQTALGNASTTNLSIATNTYLSNISSGNCLQTSTGGLITGTGSACGAGGSGNSAWTIGSGLIYNATSTDLVGIGTITPTTTLFVQGKGGTNPFAVASSTGTALFTVLSTGQAVLGVNHTTDIGVTTSAQLYLFSDTGTNQQLFKTGGDATNVITLVSGGGTLNSPSASAANTVTGSIDFSGVPSSGSGSQRFARIQGALDGSSSTNSMPGQLLFYTTATGSVTNILRVTINNQGYVGIGSATPTSNLVVQGVSGQSSATLFTVSSSTGASLVTAGVNANGVQLGVNTTTGTSIVNIVGNASNATFSILNVASSTGTTLFNVLANGNVGVGSTTPNYGFVANGTVAMPGLTTSAGLQTGVMCIGAGGQVINDSVACLASARRFKMDIKPLTGALEETLKLQGVTYYYKPSFNGALQSNPNYNGEFVGLIADDVQSVDPRLVTVENADANGSKKGQVKGLKIENIVGLLVGAIHDMEEQIKKIMFKQNADEAKMQKMQAQIDKQQQQINLLLKTK